MKMEIDKLTTEELKFIIDNFDKIKNEYQEKIKIKTGDTFLNIIEDKNWTIYQIAIVNNIDGDYICFTEINLTEKQGITESKMSLEEELFKDKYKQYINKDVVNLVIEDLYCQFEEQKKEYNKVSKRFFDKSKNILEKYELICKKCGRVFGSVRCFDVDCPYKHNK